MNDSITVLLKFNFRIQFIGWKLLALNHAHCLETALVKYIIIQFYFPVKKLILSITNWLRHYTHISFFICIFLYTYIKTWLLYKYLFFPARDWPETLYGGTIEESDLHSLFAFPFHKLSPLCIILVAAFDTIFLLEDNCQKKKRVGIESFPGCYLPNVSSVLRKHTVSLHFPQSQFPSHHQGGLRAAWVRHANLVVGKRDKEKGNMQIKPSFHWYPKITSFLDTDLW